MSFPFLFESNFEQGTNGEWDSETDTEGVLNFPHYSKLARMDASVIGPIAPFRGAYCMHIQAGDTSAHVLIEGDLDIADTVTRYSRFYFFLSKDFRATANDTLNIFELQGTADAVENAIGLRITAATQAVEIGVGQVAPTVFAAQPLTRGRWYCVELASTIQTGGTGTATLYLDGAQVAVVDTLTNTAVLRGVLGLQNGLTTTLGSMFFDQFIFDTTRVYPISQRFPSAVKVTKSGHVFVGSGYVTNAALLSGSNSDNILEIYDTDVGNTNDASNVVLELTNINGGEDVDAAGVPAEVRRGCYVKLSGTAPRAMITVGTAQGYLSTGRIRQHGHSRNSAPGGF